MGIFDKNKFSSAKQDWTTPKDFFNKLNSEFNFTFDLAASKENTLCSRFFSETDDSLKQSWAGLGTCWLNPPYGDKKENKLSNWVKKCHEECEKDKNLTVVLFIPARTNTAWFHKYCMNAKELRFVCGRPKFGNATHGLPQPLMLVVFGNSSSSTTLLSSISA